MEYWRTVKGYAGLYEVSNFGKVRSITRYLTDKNGRAVCHAGVELKQIPNSKGYMRVSLSDMSGNKKRRFVHRLVADAFEVSGAGRIVNHKDFNPLNNHADNLEYTTIHGNYAYSANRGRYVRTDEWRARLKRTLDAKCAKPIIAETIATGETIRFRALNDCKKAGFQPSCVCDCCKGKRSVHKGYTWRYDAERNESNPNP